jgi:hypothetical protein
MTWAEITAQIEEVNQRIRANEREKFALRAEYDTVRKQVGCGHDACHFYTVASAIPRCGCYECDRELAETVRGER